MSLADELARLQQLRESGALNEAEFEEAKQKAIQASNQSNRSLFGTEQAPGQLYGLPEETWCILMHLSQLLVISGLGIVVPIVMWAISKDQSELARRHGNRMMNWLLSSLIYVAAAGLLSFILIGFPLLVLILLLDFVFPIIAAYKANQGILWSYPLAIRFFDED
jgi:uncharacterized Tic20 family protein